METVLAKIIKVDLSTLLPKPNEEKPPLWEHDSKFLAEERAWPSALIEPWR